MKSKKMKIIIGFSLIVIVILYIQFAIPSVPDSPESSRPVSIGVAIYSGDDTFISNMMDYLAADVAEYEQKTQTRVYLNISEGQESQSTQNDQIERFISLGYDVLCVNLVDRTDASYIIDKAMEADIPVIFFNREPVQEDMQKWDKLYYVGSDARESAQLEAQIVIDIYKETPRSIDLNGDGVIQYIMLEGESRHQDAMIRTEVSVQTLKDAGISLEKLDGGIANWERDQASALTEKYFTEYGDQIELIICNNDDMALGAADAVKRLGLNFKNIVGIDGTAGGIKALANKQILGTVLVDIGEHANIIFNLAMALAHGYDVKQVAVILEDKSIRVPMSALVIINNDK